MYEERTTRISDDSLTDDQMSLFGCVVPGEGTQVQFFTKERDTPRTGTVAVLVSPTSVWAYAADPEGGLCGTYYLVEWDTEKWAEPIW